MAETIVFNSRRARRAQLIQAARHVLVGAVLAVTSLGALTEGHATWADVVGVAGGFILIVAFVRELRHARASAHHSGASAHPGIGWVDVFAAVVTAVEAWHLHHQGKHGLPYAYGLTAAILLALGLAHPRLARLRRLILTDDGFDLRLGPWTHLQLPWSQVTAVSSVGQVVTVTLAGGKTRRLDFSDADNGAQVVAALTRTSRRTGLDETASREATAAPT